MITAELIINYACDKDVHNDSITALYIDFKRKKASNFSPPGTPDMLAGIIFELAVRNSACDTKT